MTKTTRGRIPPHLLKYVVDQDYQRYTSEDQAVWRYIMRQLESFLITHAHASYREGLKKTGLETDRIPRIDDVDAHLEKFGWGAVPVSGFIPPAAFMEFQSIGVLPIASDMRSIDHLLYTPAPDIVHEAAGHAPILVDEEYAAYLKLYGEVARHTIISKEDMEQYEAIRVLSDLKEDPRSTHAAIAQAEAHLNRITASMKNVSEAALLSRMNWWTAEYGLIGDLAAPKIYGAGLLSSVGESRGFLSAAVRKIPLSVDCVKYAYDITEPQPQLFVAEDFIHLSQVLEELAERLAYRRGGVFGLERAIEAETVNSVQLNSGLQISGLLKAYMTLPERAEVPVYLQFSGPCQLAISYRELSGHGVIHHAQGFSTPLGHLKNHSRCLSTYSSADLKNMALSEDRRARLEFESGVQVEGVFNGSTFIDGRLVLLSWKDCRVTWGEKLLFDPAWGEFDMAVGANVTSVFGGPADRSRFGQTEDFVAKRVPAKTFTPQEVQRHSLFRQLRKARETVDANLYQQLFADFIRNPQADWLQGVELLELSYKFDSNEAERARLIDHLQKLNYSSNVAHQSMQDGIALAPVEI